MTVAGPCDTTWVMRYAQGGGLTPREQERRESLRLEASRRFEAGDKTADIGRI